MNHDDVSIYDKEIMNWWNAYSVKYQKDSKIPLDSAHYGPYAPNEDNLKLLGDIKGKKILEIGCGGGQCSIALAKQGAKCIALDVSIEQLKFAKRLAKEENSEVEFIQGSFEDLNCIDLGSQDIVFSAFALQYASHIDRVFNGVYAVLREKGLFIYSLDHPFYLIFDELAPRISGGYYKIKHSYFKTGKFVDYWPFCPIKEFVIYKRKVSDYYNELVLAGFLVEQIIEPFDAKQNLWREMFPSDLCELVGSTIIFKSRKIEKLDANVLEQARPYK